MIKLSDASFGVKSWGSTVAALVVSGNVCLITLPQPKWNVNQFNNTIQSLQHRDYTIIATTTYSS